MVVAKFIPQDSIYDEHNQDARMEVAYCIDDPREFVLVGEASAGKVGDRDIRFGGCGIVLGLMVGTSLWLLWGCLGEFLCFVVLLVCAPLCACMLPADISHRGALNATATPCGVSAPAIGRWVA